MYKSYFPDPDNVHHLNKYFSFIDGILNKRENLRIGYMEEHHILPKSLFLEGDIKRDSPENLIYLTPREHYIAHKLLARAYAHNHKVVSAFWYMSNNGRHKFASKEYDEARERFSLEHSKIMSGENNPFYGKSHTRESIDKMKGHLPDYSGVNNPFYGKKHNEESLKKMSKSHKGVSLTEEHKKRISQSLIGNKRRLGYKYTEEEKENLKKRIFHKNCKICGKIFETKSNFVTKCKECKERITNEE